MGVMIMKCMPTLVILLNLILFVLPLTCIAETTFHVLLKGSSEKINCQYLEMKNLESHCKTNNSISTYALEVLDSITVFYKGKSFDIQNMDKQKFEKMEDAVNRINEDKVAQVNQEEEKNNSLKCLLTKEMRNILLI